MRRYEIEEKYKWNLSDLYASDENWENAFNKLKGMLPGLKELKEGLTDSARSLAEALKKIDEASLIGERLYVFAKMRRDEDNGNTKHQAMTDRAMSLLVSLGAEVSFVAPALLAQDEKKLEEFVAQEAALAPYAFMIRDTIRQKQHVLGESEERLLSLSSDFASGAHDIFTMLENADMKFGEVDTPDGKVQLTHGKYIELMQNKSRQVRKDAYETYYSSFRGHINTIASTYSTSVKKDVFYARARKYPGVLPKALFSDNVPESLYGDLINCVHNNLGIMYDYVDMRKKLLGLGDIAMYDIYVPLVAETGERFSFEQAMDMVFKALEPMGEEYIGILNRALNDRWIDVFENEGKTSGAYSWGAYGVHPYVLLNHRGDLDSVYTIAHELGHAMHTWYSENSQPYPLAGYTIFVAEVASTVNEILLTKYLLKNADENLKKYVLNHYLDQFRTTVLRQTMFAEFEKISHEMVESGEPLTHESLSLKYAELNRLYYGGGIKADDTIALEWARIPHFYNAFYVYKYATGFSSAVMIATGIYEKKQGQLEAYKEFLKSGGSDYPLNLLKKAGVDFTAGAPVKNCMSEFRKALDDFQKIINVL
jgi:oligoendopeptidase F